MSRFQASGFSIRIVLEPGNSFDTPPLRPLPKVAARLLRVWPYLYLTPET